MNAMMFLGIVGPWQVILILAVVLLLFGGKKVPELMKGLGKGIRNFKEGMNEPDEDEKNQKSKE
jgi:sec-independent protein translocase protein TatA